MTGKVLALDDILFPDRKATKISEIRQTWWMDAAPARNEWEDIYRHVFATNTSQTSNSSNPWKNKTTVPKLCQITDNLIANYKTRLNPKRKNIFWEPFTQDSAGIEKAKAITNYSRWTNEQFTYNFELNKAISDFVIYGNAFGTVRWIDQRVEHPDRTQSGYVGPTIQRISPYDIVFNPTADSFMESPKIIRSIISFGELKSYLEQMSTDQNREEYEELYRYLKEIRGKAREFEGEWIQQDNLFQMEGFGSFRDYLRGDTVEILTFYGDYYDSENDELGKNRVVTIVDRHKLINDKPNPSYFGYPPIVHVPWRQRQDNLWGMSPLANLIGMQYRMDHIENMMADVWDLTVFPVQKVKGFVEDYIWQPGEKIFVSEEGDVELVTPDVNVFQGDMKIDRLASLMEAMAGAPAEAMGIRSPGEKTAYEVSRLENASGRIFNHRSNNFEENFVEPLNNYMIELARRNMVGPTTIKVMDEFSNATFQTLTVQDITGVGRIRPVAARHFAEQAEFIQNITNLTSSGAWPIIAPHWSGEKLAQAMQSNLNMDDYEFFLPYVGLTEQAEAQKHMQVLQEQVHMSAGTATGMGEDFDIDPEASANIVPQVPQEQLQ